MADTELERIYTIPLRKVKAGSRNARTDRAVRTVRAFLVKHMKSDDIWIDDGVNRLIWSRGKYKVPSRLRVRAVKFDDGVVEVSLPEEDQMTSIRAALKEERESKTPILPTPEGEAEEEEETESAQIEAEPEEEGEGAGEIEAEPEESAKPTGEIEAEPEPEPEPEPEKSEAEAPQEDEKEPAESGSEEQKKSGEE